MAAAHLQGAEPFVSHLHGGAPLAASVMDKTLDGKYRDLYEMMGSIDQCCVRLNRLWHLMQLHSDRVAGVNPMQSAMQQPDLLEESRALEQQFAMQQAEEFSNHRAMQQPFRLNRGHPNMATKPSSISNNIAATAHLAGLLQQCKEGLSEVPEVMEEHLLQEPDPLEEAFLRGAVPESNRFDNLPMQLRQALVESGQIQTQESMGLGNENHKYPSLELLSAEMRRQQLGSWQDRMPRQASRPRQNQHIPMQQSAADELAKAVAANLAVMMSASQLGNTQPLGHNSPNAEHPTAQARSKGDQMQHRTLNQPGQAPQPDLDSNVMKEYSTGDSGPAASEALDDANLPSLGSARHSSRQCKPCLFWYQSACHKGKRCLFCHIPHDDGEVRKVRPSKKTRNLLEQHRIKELHQ